jgi:hypothetical protein
MSNRVTILALSLLLAAGCKQHPLTDYRPLDQAGMWSDTVEQLKKLNVSDAEVAQLVVLKNSGISDDACAKLVSMAHQRQQFFVSSNSVKSLSGAGFSETQILELANAGQLDTLSTEAVTLHLIGLSDATVQTILRRRLRNQPTLSSTEISRLKNTGLTEKQIVERVQNGMTDAQADKEIALREATRNHANTGFVRVAGRRPRS